MRKKLAIALLIALLTLFCACSSMTSDDKGDPTSAPTDALVTNAPTEQPEDTSALTELPKISPKPGQIICPAGYNKSDFHAIVRFLEQRYDELYRRNGDYSVFIFAGMDMLIEYDPNSPETWYPGIVWNDEGRLTEVKMPDMELVGNLDLSCCTALRDIDLSGNLLTSISVSLHCGSEVHELRFKAEKGAYIGFRAVARDDADYLYCVLSVIPMDGYEFAGWYDQYDRWYSYSTEYAFRPQEEIPDGRVLTAKMRPVYEPEPAGELEERVIAGEVIALNDGKPIDKNWEGVTVDFNGDGIRESITLKADIWSVDDDVEYSLIANGKWHLGMYSIDKYDDLRMYLASLDGENVQLVMSYKSDGRNRLMFYEFCDVFCSMTERYVGANLRLAADGTMENFKFRDTLEAYVRDGHYLVPFDGDEIDLDGDGVCEIINVDTRYRADYVNSIYITVGETDLYVESFEPTGYGVGEDGSIVFHMEGWSDDDDYPPFYYHYFYRGGAEFERKKYFYNAN